MNIDYLAARYGLEMVADSEDVGKLDNIVTSALNILHLQGVYAMFLWLNAKPERRVVGCGLNRLLSDPGLPLAIEGGVFPVGENAGEAAVHGSLVNVRERLTRNLSVMFFAKEIINQTLIYARHGAKAN